MAVDHRRFGGLRMELSIALNADLERRLAAEANRHGVLPAEWARHILEAHLPSQPLPATTAADLIESWLNDPDEQEQRETGEVLIRALDEGRPGERKLFPPEAKGVTW